MKIPIPRCIKGNDAKKPINPDEYTTESKHQHRTRQPTAPWTLLEHCKDTTMGLPSPLPGEWWGPKPSLGERPHAFNTITEHRVLLVEPQFYNLTISPWQQIRVFGAGHIPLTDVPNAAQVGCLEVLAVLKRSLHTDDLQRNGMTGIRVMMRRLTLCEG